MYMRFMGCIQGEVDGETSSFLIRLTRVLDIRT